MNEPLQQHILFSRFPRAFASPSRSQAERIGRGMGELHRSGREFPRRTAQQGAVLLVALVFLILLTLLAIGASSGSLLQQRMVAATRSAQLADMTADAALRGAEWKLWSSSQIVGQGIICDEGDINPATGCVIYDPTSALYAPGGAVAEFRSSNNAWLPTTLGQQIYMGAADLGYTSRVGALQATANVADDPQYIIEKLGPATASSGPACESGDTGCNRSGSGSLPIFIYRITARATGGSQGTVRVVQSTFDALND